MHDKRLYSEPFPDIDIDYVPNNDSEDEKEDFKEGKEDDKEDEKEDGLFILGVIKSAVKERKRTKSVVVK